MEKNKYEINYKFKKGDIVVFGCSSGPDSMALFSMLLDIREENDLKLICAHVNHNVRKESEEEEKYLYEFCKKKNVVFETMKIEKYGDDNFHNEARTIRYNFFYELVKKYSANILMTAHHADDLIETILMRIVRGSNLNGYSGFHYLVEMGDYKIVRPLIHYTKEELIEYIASKKVKYYIDKSNMENKYTRNRYRKEVIPFLKEEDKQVHLKFLKYSNILEKAYNYIKQKTVQSYKRVMEDDAINIDKFLQEDEYIQKELLYFLLEKYYQDDLLLVSDKHIELLYKLIKNRKANVSYNLPNDVLAIKEYNKCYLTKNCDIITAYEIEFDDSVTLLNNHSIEQVSFTDNNSNYICRLNSEEIVLPLIVRTRKLGDKIYVKGMNGSKKVKDIFINDKISQQQRNLWPIVLDSAGKILWIPGIKKSKFCKTKSEKCDIILKYR